jgi:hypothetical protein
LAAFIDFAGVKHELSVIRRYLEARPGQITDSLFEFEDSQVNILVADDTCSKLHRLVERIEHKILKWTEQKDGEFWIWST